MVTGAAGSIGTELCRQILQCRPEKLLCVDQDETALFHLGEALDAAETPYGKRHRLQIADVADTNRMRKLLAEGPVQVVFHAAAYKHVPLVEDNVAEAARNNVIALWDLLEIAEIAGCGRFVLVSSDKAVEPSSFMGCTKRIGELLVASRPSSGMRSMGVRFGNVLGSQGSVLPTFKRQIARGEAITITHPAMERYFISASAAVSLVLQASAAGENGDIFVLDMGSPVRIVDLAKGLLKLYGKSEAEVPFRYIGPRPGEKLREKLFYDDERKIPTGTRGLHKVKGRSVDWPVLRHQLQQLAGLLDSDSDSIRKMAKEIVPEYRPHFAPAQQLEKPETPRPAEGRFSTRNP
jgi:FlaA1/EpsC-like NDP-sugar epimerase